MSKSKDKIVEQLESEVKEFKEKEPCRAYKASLLLFKEKGWLPKPETPCKELFKTHQKNYDLCTISLAPSRTPLYFNGKDLPEDHYNRKPCKEVYRHQMEVARCLVGDSLKLDNNRVPISVRDLLAWHNAQILLYRDMIRSPNPFVRYFQKQGYAKDPIVENEQMRTALEESYELFRRCLRVQNPSPPFPTPSHQ